MKIHKKHKMCQKNKSIEALCSIFLLIMVFSIAQISLISAAEMVFDNIKFFDKNVGDYGKITIRDNLGITKLYEAELKTNTDNCAESCSAETEIVLHQTTSLIDEVRFMTQLDSGEKEEAIRSYQFYIQTGGTNITVPTYEIQCEKDWIAGNGSTVKGECSKVQIGTHEEEAPEWTPYTLGTEMSAGTYQVKLEGKKKPSRTVDWQITTQGKLIDEWALWGGSVVDGNDLTALPLNGTEGGTVFPDYASSSADAPHTWTSTGGAHINTSLADPWSQNIGVARFNGSNFISAPDSDDWDCSGGANCTIDAWVYVHTLPPSGADSVWGQEDGTTGDWFTYIYNDGRFTTGISGVRELNSPAGVISAGQWYHLAVVKNAGTTKTYVDGLEQASSSLEYFTASSEIMRLGGTPNQLANVSISMFRFSNVSRWTQNFSVPGAFEVGVGYITLDSPADNYISPSNSVQFNCSATAGTGATVSNISLWHNGTGTWHRNQTAGIQTCSQEFANVSNACGGLATGSYATGGVAWVAEPNLYDGNWGTRTTNPKDGGESTITISYAKPAGAISAIWYIKSDNQATRSLVINDSNCFGSDPVVMHIKDNWNSVASTGRAGCNDGSDWLYTTVSSDGGLSEENMTWIFNQTVSLNDNSASFTTTIINPTLWTCSATDSDNVEGFASENRTIFVDTEAPSLTIFAPTTNINYAYTGFNQSLNFSVTDDGTLSSCWFTYNDTSVNNTISCTTNSSFLLGNYTDKTLTLWANDSVGNLNSSTISWNYSIWEYNQTFPTSALETSNQNFTITINHESTDWSVVAANLIFNNTVSAGTKVGTGNLISFTNNFNIPLGTGTQDFLWNISLTNSSGTLVLSSKNNSLTVNPFELQSCNATLNTTVMNFTSARESNLTSINPFLFEGTFEYSIGGGTSKILSVPESSGGSHAICISPADATIEIKEAHITYDNSSGTFVRRDYYFQNHTVTNSSENVTLYLLESADSTSFILKVQDSVLLPIEGALVHIEKYYPGLNEYRTVQVGKTDDNGKSVGFYQTETVTYRHTITKDGVTLLITTPQKIIGEESPFTLTFTIGDDLDEPTINFDDTDDLVATLEYDKSAKEVTFTYVDTSGNFTEGRLLVERINWGSGDTVVCNDTSTNPTATLVCDTSAQNGTYRAQGFISRSPQTLKKAISFIQTLAQDIFGNTGLILGWMIILTMGMTAIWNPTVGIILVNISTILLNLTGIVVFSPIYLFGLIGVSVTLLIIMRT